MTEGTPSTPSTGQPAAEGPQGQTVEERDAYWQGRIGGEARAHNAALAAQREQFEAQIAALRNPTPPANESPEAARIRELEQRAAAAEQRAAAQEMRAKYPYAAAVLGDDITALPEARVAAVDASRVDASTEGQATNGAGFPIIDPNSARRNPVGMPAVKPASEKSIEELEADLRGLAPAYQRALQDR